LEPLSAEEKKDLSTTTMGSSASVVSVEVKESKEEKKIEESKEENPSDTATSKRKADSDPEKEAPKKPKIDEDERKKLLDSLVEKVNKVAVSLEEKSKREVGPEPVAHVVHGFKDTGGCFLDDTEDEPMREKKDELEVDEVETESEDDEEEKEVKQPKKSWVDDFAKIDLESDEIDEQKLALQVSMSTYSVHASSRRLEAYLPANLQCAGSKFFEDEDQRLAVLSGALLTRQLFKTALDKKTPKKKGLAILRVINTSLNPRMLVAGKIYDLFGKMEDHTEDWSPALCCEDGWSLLVRLLVRYANEITAECRDRPYQGPLSALMTAILLNTHFCAARDEVDEGKTDLHDQERFYVKDVCAKALMTTGLTNDTYHHVELLAKQTVPEMRLKTLVKYKEVEKHRDLHSFIFMQPLTKFGPGVAELTKRMLESVQH
jgi:hypothetical protein